METYTPEFYDADRVTMQFEGVMADVQDTMHALADTFADLWAEAYDKFVALFKVIKEHFQRFQLWLMLISWLPMGQRLAYLIAQRCPAWLLPPLNARLTLRLLGLSP